MKRALRDGAWMLLAAGAFFLATHLDALPPRVLAPADLLGIFAPWSGTDPPPAPGVANHLLLDVVLQFLPWYEFSAGELAQGRLPLWNPHQGLGGVHFANDPPAVLSPWSVPYYLFGPQGLYLAALGRALLLALGVFVFLRAQGLSRRASLLGGLALMASGPVIAWQDQHHTGVFAFAGWLLLFAERSLTGPRPGRAALCLAATTALTLLSGHLQTALHLALLVALWIGVLAAARARREGPGALGALARPIGGALLGAGIAAIHLVPFAAALGDSVTLLHRSGGASAVAPPEALAGLLFPELLGNPRDGYVSPVLGLASFLELSPIYVGASVLLVAVLGGSAEHDPRRRRLVRTFAAAALLGGAVVFLGPVSRLLEQVPPFSFTRNHRLAFIAAFGLATVGAAGLDALLRLPRQPSRRALAWLLAGVAAAVALGASAGDYALWTPGPRGRWGRGGTWALAVPGAALLGAALILANWRRLGPRRGGALLAAITVSELLAFAWGYSPGADPAQLFPPIPGLEQARGERLLGVGKRVLPPNTGARYGIRQVRCYDALGNRHVEPELRRLAPFRGPLMGAQRFDERVANRLSVRFLLTDDPRLADNLSRGLSGWLPGSQFSGGPGVGVPAGGLRQDLVLPGEGVNALVLPEVRCVRPTRLALRLVSEHGPLREARVELAAGVREALFRFPALGPGAGPVGLELRSDPPGAEVLRSSTDQLPDSVLVSGGRPLPGDLTLLFARQLEAYPVRATWRGAWLLENPAALPRVRLEEGGGRASFRWEQPRELLVDVEAEQPSRLILADAYAPGWDAFVDGRPRPVIPAAGLRAVEVPAGRSAVRFVYRPLGVRLGLALTLVSLLVWGLLAWRTATVSPQEVP